MSALCPLACRGPLAGGSTDLPLVVAGEDGLLDRLTELGDSGLVFDVRAAPGLDLPAETALSGNVVLKFGGASSRKSGGITDCCDRTLGLGELGRDVDVWLRPFDRIRPVATERLGVDEEVDTEFRRVGVDGREFDLVEGKLKLAGICGLELGVDGLEPWEGRVLSLEEMVGAERDLEGVEDREDDVRVDGVEGLEVDDERVIGEEGLMYDETEAELVLRIEEDLLEV